MIQPNRRAGDVRFFRRRERLRDRPGPQEFGRVKAGMAGDGQNLAVVRVHHDGRRFVRAIHDVGRVEDFFDVLLELAFDGSVQRAAEDGTLTGQCGDDLALRVHDVQLAAVSAGQIFFAPPFQPDQPHPFVAAIAARAIRFHPGLRDEADVADGVCGHAAGPIHPHGFRPRLEAGQRVEGGAILGVGIAGDFGDRYVPGGIRLSVAGLDGFRR